MAAESLTDLMLQRFVLGLRRDGSTAPPSAEEVAQAEQLARAWSAFDLAEARDWLDWCPQVTPDVATELTLAGVTPEEAAERLWLGRRTRHRAPLWSRVQFREIDATQAVEELRRGQRG